MNQLLLPLLLMLVVAVPLVMGSRKQKRAAAAQQELQNGLADGDRVMTTSGLYGTVADTSSETTIDVEIAPGVVTTWLRQAVREKVQPEVVEEDSLDTEVEDDASSLTETTPVVVEDEKEKSTAQVAPPLEHGKK
ncbi:preprotein translocase subunit YajC [Amycolatopsis sp.]|jgi:preprotein translocase subunit YajC|uniref:preprotein translocase subunit YajC n=1 Tax=Amycolatopsis sp. TaxID=37632 RepID=UPI002E0A63A2|nr:preprotein translocase subunit YajC [Amycolatopsis sp.]